MEESKESEKDRESEIEKVGSSHKENHKRIIVDQSWEWIH